MTENEEMTAEERAAIEAEQERLEAEERARIEHENMLNSFPETTVFYDKIIINGDVQHLAGYVRNAHTAEKYGWLDNHIDMAELTAVGTMLYIKGHERPQPTMQEMIDRKKAEMDAVVQELLDSTAKTKGFTNGAYCAGYAGDPDPEFDAHGTAFKIWRSKVWRKCYQILDQVESGEIPIEDITAEYVLGQLPEIEW